MSHLHERKEKNCLNCQSELTGRYCHKCGQENLEPKETVWHLIQHFFNDITHFDGKFFDTVKYLIRRPGFLSLEYMRGRRMSYLNPIRMYVFTSAIFFIILFSMTRPEDMAKGFREDKNKKTEQTTKDLAWLRSDTARLNRDIATEDDKEDRQDYQERLIFRKIQLAAITKAEGDTSHRAYADKELDSIVFLAYTKDSIAADPDIAKSHRYTRAVKRFVGSNSSHADFNFAGKPIRFETVEQYDSAEHALPDSLRDDWFTHFFTKRGIVIRQEWEEDKSRFIEHLAENILHSFPKILWISLPIFAMILNILYFRHKKTFFYVNHGIFAIHLYCATFIQLFLGLMIYKLGKAVPPGWPHNLTIIANFGIFLWMLVYLYKAMRGFYQQRRTKTVIKYCIVMGLMFFINLLLLTLFLLISVFSV